MRWFISDLHLGDAWAARMRYCGDDTEEMRKLIAARWDARVEPTDTVWILGDTIVGMDVEEAAAWLSERPGTKHHVQGNHDRIADIVRLPVSHLMHVAHIRIGEDIATMSHFPTEHARAGVLLHGHTHRSRKYVVEDGVIKVHVGWDAWRRPVSEQDVINVIALARSEMSET